MIEENKNIENPETEDSQIGSQSKRCLNCGEELMGHYCHNCGQEVLTKTPTIGGFILAYLDNAFLWDSQFLKTLWTLLRRPGQLTKEFLAGKYSSQEHPLKLNMFLLFIFVTLFVFFASGDKMTNSAHSLINDERVFSSVQLESMQEDAAYSQKIAESSRDTVLLRAPLFIADSYPQIVSKVVTVEDTKGEGVDKWVAVIPQVFIDDEIVIIDEEGTYRFNPDTEFGRSNLDLTHSVIAEIIRLTSQYFPILLLLTAPILSISLSLVQRRSKLRKINYFIFALHYTAFLEFFIICIYILYLTLAPSMDILEYVMMISSCVYLTIAYHRVYASSWVTAFVKSVLTSLIYCIILLMIFAVIIFIACFIIAAQMV